MTEKEKAAPGKLKPEELSAAEITKQCNALRDGSGMQRFRTASVLSHYYSYGSFIGVNATAFDPNVPSSRFRALESLTHANAMRSVIDTALSQCVRTPDLRVQTIGASWKKQRSCRKIAQWLSGSFRRNNIQDLIWQVATDSKTTPLGAIRAWMEDDGLHLARVRPDTIYSNPKEGKKPRNLWLRYGVPRSELAAQHPEHAEYIREKAPAYEDDQSLAVLDQSGGIDADQVEVIEHWRLGTSKQLGSYSIVVGDKKLTDDEWELDFFPVFELRDMLSYNSFGGHSLGEMLLPYQLQLTRMARVIETAQARMSVSRVFIPRGSEIDKQQFSRTPGEFIEFNNLGGGPPVIQAAQACSSDYYQRFDNTLRDMYRLAGVSESQSAGLIPRGMDGASGKAIREINDTAATRRKSDTDGLDNFFERLSAGCLALAIRWFKAGSKSAKVRAPGTGILVQVDFADLDLSEDDGIEVRCISVSGLPQHPSAKLEYVKELVEAGFVNRRYGTKLLAIPDVDKIEDVTTSAMDLATHHIEMCLDDGKQAAPEPNREYLEILLDIGTRELLVAVRLNAPEENVELLRRLLEIGQDQLDKLGSSTPGAAPATPQLAQLDPMAAADPAMQAANMGQPPGMPAVTA